MFDETGNVCNVVEAFAVRHNSHCFKISFSDGSCIIADADHEWPVATRKLRMEQSERRRSESRQSAIRQFEDYRKLCAVRDSVAGADYMHTISSAGRLVSGLCGSDRIARVRKRQTGRDLGRNELFDVRPVLDEVVSARYENLSLAKPRPPSHTLMTTDEMSRHVKYCDGGLNLAIEVAGALDGDESSDLPIDPYVLGAWLGDGSSRSAQITTPDQEIIDKIRRRGYFVKKLKAKLLYSIHLTPHPASKSSQDCVTKRLGKLRVQSNKHIPAGYLRASYRDRLDLLRGIMDTDGSVIKTGRSSIDLTNERLAYDLVELMRTLGLKPTIRKARATITDPDTKVRRVVGWRWRIGMVTALPIFLFSRKAARLPATVRDTQRFRYITSIELVSSRPVRCISVDSPSHLYLAGEAMIPTHNSLAVLAPAVQRAVEFGERTVVSTETLGLQSQILDKDAPTVNRAADKLYGRGADVAVLKGFSNYVCSMSLDAVARDVIGKLAPDRAGRLPQQADSQTDFTGIADAVDALLDDQAGHRIALRSTLTVDETDLNTADLLAMLSWAARQAADNADTPNAGDKAAYTGNATGQMFGKISVGPDECLGAKSCPLADLCLPLKARERAAEADIIVTNHALLGVQAAHNASVVISNKTIGNIDHVVVDEAHTLPGIVRSQGAGELSGRRIQSTSRVIRRVFDETDAYHEQLLAEASRLATAVDIELAQSAGKFLPSGAVARADNDADPVESTGTQIEAWIDAAQAIVKQVRRHTAGSNQIKCIRATSALTKLGDALKQVREHEVGVARWIEKTMPARPGEREWTVAKTSPVAVSGMLASTVYTAEDVEPGTADNSDALGELTIPDDQGGQEPERYNLSVVAVSATLPKSFPFDAGVQSRLSYYESPFDDAYASSAFYAPKSTSADLRAIAVKGGNGKTRLGTSLHPEWALTNHVIPLVDANGGSALVVTATAATGKKFAERLQQHFAGRFRVYSQWEPRNLRGIIADWKNDIPSVLVGTRSLMSGVDAPGPTCSLVVLDRVPRAPANPVDDARVEVLTDGKSDMSKWTANRFVYASDAALILEQAAGRLIRSITDTGMVAVLDPRLVKNTDLSYGADTRKTYMKALARFDTRYSSIDKAVAFLTGQSGSRVQKGKKTTDAASSE